MSPVNGQLTIEPGAELPWPCPHHWDPRAPECHTFEPHCCLDDHCRHDDPEEDQ